MRQVRPLARRLWDGEQPAGRLAGGPVGRIVQHLPGGLRGVAAVGPWSDRRAQYERPDERPSTGPMIGDIGNRRAQLPDAAEVGQDDGVVGS